MSTMLELDDELVSELQSQAATRELPWQRWALMILTGAVDRPNGEPKWDELNGRRLELIQRKNTTGLDAAEDRELTALQAAADKHLEAVDRQRLEWLKPYEQLAESFAQQSDE